MQTLCENLLFNCCTDFKEPTWGNFIALELGGCEESKEERGETFIVGGISRDRAQFFTVYARDHEGLAEAITDIPKYLGACLVLAALAEMSGLPSSVAC